MARKRAPGGGRKPRGAGPAVQFNTRISPEVRRQLELVAKRNGRSLSREIEVRLRQSLAFEKEWEGIHKHHHALARLVSIAARDVEGFIRPPDKSWRDDVFAARALRAAL